MFSTSLRKGGIVQVSREDYEQYLVQSDLDYIVACARQASCGRARAYRRVSARHKRKAGSADTRRIRIYAGAMVRYLLARRVGREATDDDLVALAEQYWPSWRQITVIDRQGFLAVLRHANGDYGRAALDDVTAAVGMIITIGLLMNDFDREVPDVLEALYEYLAANGSAYEAIADDVWRVPTDTV